MLAATISKKNYHVKQTQFLPCHWRSVCLSKQNIAIFLLPLTCRNVLMGEKIFLLYPATCPPPWHRTRLSCWCLPALGTSWSTGRPSIAPSRRCGKDRDCTPTRGVLCMHIHMYGVLGERMIKICHVLFVCQPEWSQNPRSTSPARMICCHPDCILKHECTKY